MSLNPKEREEIERQLNRAIIKRPADPELERAAAYVYSMIRGYDNFLNLEEGITAYSAAAEKRGYREGIVAGLRIRLDRKIIKRLQKLEVLG